MTEFVSWISNGKVDRPTHNAIADLLNRLNGKQVRISIAIAKKKRSLKQNAFLHGPFLEAARIMFHEAGMEYSHEQVKSILKAKFGPQELAPIIGDDYQWIPKSTADYTTVEAETMMEKARAWAATWGYELPHPRDNE